MFIKVQLINQNLILNRYVFELKVVFCVQNCSDLLSKLYIPSTLNNDLILWHTQLIVCAENIRSWFKS